MLNFARPFILLGVLGSPMSAHAFSFPWLTKAPADAGKALTTPAPVLRPGDPAVADKIVVKKAQRRLYLMRGDAPLRTYKIALGYQPTGHKLRQGDGRTPEGRYFIDQRSGASHYRKALQISYPSEADRLRALSKGIDPGGKIMIHGQPSDQRGPRSGDWTFGCIAVSNMEIDEIWSLTTNGTPVDILP